MTQLLLNLFFSLVVMIYLHHISYIFCQAKIRDATKKKLACFAILIWFTNVNFILIKFSIKKYCCGSTCYHGAGHVGEINVCIFYTQFSAHINRERGQKKKGLKNAGYLLPLPSTMHINKHLFICFTYSEGAWL